MINNNKDDLNESQNDLKQQILQINDNLNNIKKTKKNIKKMLKYNKITNKYELDVGIVDPDTNESKPLKADSIEELQEIIYTTYSNIKEQEKILNQELINQIKKEEELDFKIDILEKENKLLEGNVKKYINDVVKLEEDKTKLDKEKRELELQKKNLENEKQSIENEKKQLESITKLQKKKIIVKQKNLNLIQEELKKKNIELDRKNRYDIYYNNKTVKEINTIAKNLFNGLDQDKTKDFNQLYNNFYNLPDEEKYRTGTKIPKDKYINFILDKEDQNREQEIQNEPEQIQEEQKQEQEGEGKMKGGLWTNQINKIMEVNKYYIDTIANNELDEILNYIYNNNILKGCFIMNTLNSYDHSVGHWVAIYYDVSNDGEYTLEYFDPFANDPENNKLISKFKKLFEKMGIDAYVKVKINQIKQQSINSSNCGWFCLRFLLERTHAIPWKISTKYKKISKNEKDISEIKKHYNKYGFI